MRFEAHSMRSRRPSILRSPAATGLKVGVSSLVGGPLDGGAAASVRESLALCRRAAIRPALAAVRRADVSSEPGHIQQPSSGSYARPPGRRWSASDPGPSRASCIRAALASSCAYSMTYS